MLYAVLIFRWMFFHLLTGLMNARYLPCHWKVLSLLGMNGWLLFRRLLFLLYFKVDFSVLCCMFSFFGFTLWYQFCFSKYIEVHCSCKVHCFPHISSFLPFLVSAFCTFIFDCAIKLLSWTALWCKVAYIFLAPVSELSIIYVGFLCTPLQKPIYHTVDVNMFGPC